MIRLSQLKHKIDVHRPDIDLTGLIASKLRVDKAQIDHYVILRRSVDARKKPELFYVYTLMVALKGISEAKCVAKLHDQSITVEDFTEYSFPYHIDASRLSEEERPVIVGTGPAGLFCGYVLAMNGFRPILVERGEAVEDRIQSVEHFWNTGELNPESNIQFGEGGAGTFSDGKLNTLVKDRDGRNRAVLKIFTENGAKDTILYDYKAHLGTDCLIDIIRTMREKMKQNGANFEFGSKMTGLELSNESVAGIRIQDSGAEQSTVIPCRDLVLAIGHSARDTFPMLLDMGVQMESKDFAVGFRIMHPQKLINYSQYGIEDPYELGSAPYKVVGKEQERYNTYSFCMCPGGYVVNASSEPGRLAVNGMSYSDRASDCANSALVMNVHREDYPYGPLGGIEFQRELESRAYRAADGKIPMQELGAYYREIKNHPYEYSCGEQIEAFYNDFSPCVKGQKTMTSLKDILPENLSDRLLDSMAHFDHMIHGFAHPKSVFAGIESRTSSPVRILRDENCESNIHGLYPCGEGAGYAGGITSAAIDGIRVAEKIAAKIISRQVQ